MTTTIEERARQVQERARELSNDYATALQEVQDAWPASRAVELRASCDGADGERTTIHVDLAATQAFVAGRASVDINDDEIALVVVGLTRVARARSTQVHSLTQVDAAKDLLDKLGFPFVEEASMLVDVCDGDAPEVLPEGETEFPIPNTDGTTREA